MNDPMQIIQEAIRMGHRGWFQATSGNISYRLSHEPLRFAITVSGSQKDELSVTDFVALDADLQPIASAVKPSAESVVHRNIYQKLVDVGVIFHVHTPTNTALSLRYQREQKVSFAGYEMIKALGLWAEDASLWVPVVRNHADLKELGVAVSEVATQSCPGVLVAGHGLYAWGFDLAAARRHTEALEFLFEAKLWESH